MKRWIERYGADTVRLFCLFAAPPERDFDWTESGIEGSNRFLQRIWRLFQDGEDKIACVKACSSEAGDCASKEARELRGKEHATVKKAGEDMGQRNQFNTAIAAIMELVNAIYIFKEKMQDSEGDRKVFSSAVASRARCCSADWFQSPPGFSASMSPWSSTPPSGSPAY